MAKATIDQVREWFKASYRPQLYWDLYESLLWVTDSNPYYNFVWAENDVPLWPLLKPKRPFWYQTDGPEEGRTPFPETRMRDTFNATTILLAKLRATNIKPEYQDIESPFEAAARTAYWQKRANGTPNLPGWTQDLTSSIFDMVLTGFCCTQIGKRTNRVTGKSVPMLKRHRPLNTFLDPYTEIPSKSQRAGVLHILSVPEAEAYTGMKDLDKYASISNTSVNLYGYRRVVKVYEYYSWAEDEDPTRCLIVGNITSDCYKIEENKFGCLPFQFGEFLCVDGFELPQGAIYLQQHLEVQADAYRKRLQNIAALHAMIALNPDAISARDMQRVKSAIEGKGPMPDFITMKRKADPTAKVFEEYPGANVPPGLMQLYELTMQELRAISGIDETDRGAAIEGANTATAYNLITANSGAITGYGVYKSAIFFQNLMAKVGVVARELDNDPLMLNIEGTTMLLNNPKDPGSSCEELFKQESTVLVAEDELFGAAQDIKVQQRVQQLMADIQLPGANQLELTKEILRLQKLDVSQFAAQPGMPGQMPSGPSGMPGQPPQPGNPGQSPSGAPNDPRTALQGLMPASA